MNYQLITDSSALDNFLQSVANDRVLAIDTEFMREKTFFAQLCLVQVAGAGGAAVIDILSPSFSQSASSLSPLWDFLAKEDRIKIMHAGSQDIEIIYNLTKKIPPNIIDSQLAAAVLGLGDNLGYQKLVEMFLKKNLDKTMQYINWQNRPLPGKALDYAALDVIYLLEIYEQMEKLLLEKNRMAWLQEEMSKLLDIKSYELDYENAWRRLKKLPRDGKKLRAAQLLAAWREERAVKKNLPRGFILRDELLLDIANHLPQDPSDLRALRGAGGIIQNENLMSTIFSIIKQVMSEDGGYSSPRTEKREFIDIPENALEMLKLLLKLIAREQNVVARVIAREQDLIDFLLKKPQAKILQDWRYEVFGKRAEKLLRGDLSLKLKNSEIEFIELA